MFVQTNKQTSKYIYLIITRRRSTNRPTKVTSLKEYTARLVRTYIQQYGERNFFMSKQTLHRNVLFKKNVLLFFILTCVFVFCGQQIFKKEKPSVQKTKNIYMKNEKIFIKNRTQKIKIKRKLIINEMDQNTYRTQEIFYYFFYIFLNYMRTTNNQKSLKILKI